MEICGKKDYWEQVVYYKKYMFGFGARSRLIAEIVKRNSDKIESVLELGCNSGNNLQEINNLVPNIKLSGLDLSEPAINFGKTVDKNPAELVAGDLMDLSRFEDKSFDLVVSFSTIEHVGSCACQYAFVQEICRVGYTCCITIANRWYPVEFHTIMPFVHWLPPHLFRLILRYLGKEFFAKEENLNLLSKRDMLELFPAHAKVYIRHFKLFGMISNLLFYVEN